jgi:hypothetical protein
VLSMGANSPTRSHRERKEARPSIGNAPVTRGVCGIPLVSLINVAAIKTPTKPVSAAAGVSWCICMSGDDVSDAPARRPARLPAPASYPGSKQPA